VKISDIRTGYIRETLDESSVAPDAIEFWQGRATRLHDRIRYRRTEEHPGAWVIDRLAP
jgi:pyridoxine/pyridoxamine 5'-phosphate oxidase